MLRFLLWNTNRGAPDEEIRRLLQIHRIDVLVLLEYGGDIWSLLRAHNQSSTVPLHYHPGSNPSFHLACTFGRAFARDVYDGKNLLIKRVALPGQHEFLLALIHGRSKLHRDPTSQLLSSITLCEKIRQTERRQELDCTLVCGDLNLSPFEDAMVTAEGFNAVSSRIRAEKGTRTVEGQEYPFFYNPMWGLLGDTSPGPPGTYFRDSGDHVNHYWYMFDQVLLRPAMLSAFRLSQLEVLDSDGTISFLTESGIPDRRVSDHLPVLFKLSP